MKQLNGTFVCIFEFNLNITTYMFVIPYRSMKIGTINIIEEQCDCAVLKLLNPRTGRDSKHFLRLVCIQRCSNSGIQQNRREKSSKPKWPSSFNEFITCEYNSPSFTFMSTIFAHCSFLVRYAMRVNSIVTFSISWTINHSANFTSPDTFSDSILKI